MTYIIYSHQQLQLKSIARLKQIYSEIACTVEVSDKRCKECWITAIAEYQASKAKKVTDEQAIAPEKLITVEISFYDHEIYAASKLIATITHDDDLTQPWVVIVNGVEKFRANTWMRCHRFIQWHLNNSQFASRNSQLHPIPESEKPYACYDSITNSLDNCVSVAGRSPLRTANCELLNEAPCPTENRIMAHIFNECQNYGFEILDDGIYHNDVKLGEVGCTDGNWWVILGSSGQQQYCNSVSGLTHGLRFYVITSEAK